MCSVGRRGGRARGALGDRVETARGEKCTARGGGRRRAAAVLWMLALADDEATTARRAGEQRYRMRVRPHDVRLVGERYLTPEHWRGCTRGGRNGLRDEPSLAFLMLIPPLHRLLTLSFPSNSTFTSASNSTSGVLVVRFAVSVSTTILRWHSHHLTLRGEQHQRDLSLVLLRAERDPSSSFASAGPAWARARDPVALVANQRHLVTVRPLRLSHLSSSVASDRREHLRRHMHLLTGCRASLLLLLAGVGWGAEKGVSMLARRGHLVLVHRSRRRALRFGDWVRLLLESGRLELTCERVSASILTVKISTEITSIVLYRLQNRLNTIS